MMNSDGKTKAKMGKMHDFTNNNQFPCLKKIHNNFYKKRRRYKVVDIKYN